MVPLVNDRRESLYVTRTNPVLVIDNEPVNTVTLGTLLKYFKLESDSATSSSRVLTIVQKRIDWVLKRKARMYKLFIIDFNMTDINGVELIKRLKRMIESS